MNQYKTLFEQQSYRDALEYYLASLDNQALAVWDYVILTASNDDQAKAYQVQIEYRLKNQQIPNRTHYAVIPDLNGQRPPGEYVRKNETQRNWRGPAQAVEHVV